MSNPFKLRIIRWQFKLLYVFLAYGVDFTIGHVLAPVLPFPWIHLATYILGVATVLYGARIFRGWNEDILAPRAWWRMTARRPLSRNLGVLSIVGAGFVTFSIVSDVIQISQPKDIADLAAGIDDLSGGVSSFLLYATLAYLYLNSASRLPKPAREDDDPGMRIVKLYSALNQRLAHDAARYLHPDVEWPTGYGDDYLHGRRDVVQFWERQWQTLDPTLKPERVHIGEDGRLTVSVHETTRDLQGNLLEERDLLHIYRVRAGLYDRMEIHEVAAVTDDPAAPAHP